MNSADMIIMSNAVFTSCGDEPFEGGVAIKGNRIVAVGSREEISKYRTADNAGSYRWSRPPVVGSGSRQ